MSDGDGYFKKNEDWEQPIQYQWQGRGAGGH